MVGLVGCIVGVCRGINGDVAFPFSATYSTGATRGVGSSIGVVRRGIEDATGPRLDTVVREPDLCVASFPPVLDGHVGVPDPDGTAALGEQPVLVPPWSAACFGPHP